MSTPALHVARTDSTGCRGSPWIVAPLADLSLIVAAPILVWGGLTLAQYVWTPAQITSFALIWAIGHHLPGLMRAYGDRALFHRFRWRFICAPILVLIVGLYSSLSQSSAIPLAVGLWGFWHYLMQTYGFLRIYDSKVRSVSPLTCRLDQAMCLAWFAAPMLLTSNSLFAYLNMFYKAGGPVVLPGL
ncbi:MAG: yrrB 4, partial [Planctomycetaceae bacterium]|nr:yrrB 4 [Planctomycetaceae bacterium]